MSEKLWCLKRCELFQRLDPDQVVQIEQRSRSKDYPAQTSIYLPTEESESVFVLARGLIRISYITRDGKESILAFVEPGEMFGELAMFSGPGRDELVTAVKPSTVVMIPIAEMRELMARQTDVCLALTKLVGLRRRRIERRLKHLLFLSNQEKLVHLLLDLAEQFGVREGNGIRLRIKLSHQELANLIGSTRETVTVLLGQLKADRLVSGGRCQIVLNQPAALARSVNRQWSDASDSSPLPTASLAFI